MVGVEPVEVAHPDPGRPAHERPPLAVVAVPGTQLGDHPAGSAVHLAETWRPVRDHLWTVACWALTGTRFDDVSAIDGVTLAEAARILGASVWTVRRHIDAGDLPVSGPVERRRLSRADVEQLAVTLSSAVDPLDDGEPSYWVRNQGAAEILGVSPQRVRQLIDAGRLPADRHSSGCWLMRREQVLTIANAREARWR